MKTYNRRGVIYELIVGDQMDSVRVTNTLIARGPQVVILDKDQTPKFVQWINGYGLIQDNLPELSADDREILMTGIGPKQWAEMFPKGDE